MLKKIAVAALTAGFTLASFAQAGAGAPNSIPPSGDPAPAAAEAPMPAKHAKKHHAKKKHARHAHKKHHAAAQ